jgi:hypothetical protein
VPGSDRAFGWIVAAGLAGLAAFAAWRGQDVRALTLAALAAILASIALFAPVWLGPINRGWFRFGLLLGRIVSPLVLAIMFYLVVTPVALFARLRGADPLKLRFDPRCASYWVARSASGPVHHSMRDPF